MSRIIRQRPSPSMIVAGAALVVALAGTAIAGPLATKSALNKAEKNQVKKLARGEINKAAPGLTVANANTVDGANASDLKTSSAFDENTTQVASLGASFVDVATATITTHSAGHVLATGSIQLDGDDSGEAGACEISIDGSDSAIYSSAPDDIGFGNPDVIAVNFAVTRPAGTYTARLKCFASVGTVGKTAAAINVYGLGA
jgi:hypothetical protein